MNHASYVERKKRKTNPPVIVTVPLMLLHPNRYDLYCFIDQLLSIAYTPFYVSHASKTFCDTIMYSKQSKAFGTSKSHKKTQKQKKKNDEQSSSDATTSKSKKKPQQKKKQTKLSNSKNVYRCKDGNERERGNSKSSKSGASKSSKSLDKSGSSKSSKSLNCRDNKKREKKKKKNKPVREHVTRSHVGPMPFSDQEVESSSPISHRMNSHAVLRGHGQYTLKGSEGSENDASSEESVFG